jgi:hypothetical protein
MFCNIRVDSLPGEFLSKKIPLGITLNGKHLAPVPKEFLMSLIKLPEKRGGWKMKKIAGILIMLGVFMFASGTAQAQYYGAIAYSEATGNWGTAYDYGSRAHAERDALSRCNSADCEIKCWFRNSCGALAKGEGGLGWSWAAGSREEAEALAIANCEEHGTDCRIICWVCTTR